MPAMPVPGFQHQDEAERFLSDLKDRLAKFGMKLHPEKTRLIEFGRYATERREKRGEGNGPGVRSAPLLIP
jgi:RNA-directed DNA polymerase